MKKTKIRRSWSDYYRLNIYIVNLTIAALLIIGTIYPGYAQDLSGEQNAIFWKVNANKSISWDLTTEQKLPHADNIEMSGQLVSAIVRYQVDEDKHLLLTRDIIFPQLRAFPKPGQSEYRAYLRNDYGDDVLPVISLKGRKFEPGVVDSANINGKISFYYKERNGIRLIRTFFPSMTTRAVVEKWTLINTTSSPQTLTIGTTEYVQNETGLYGQYKRRVFTDAQGSVTIAPSDRYAFGIYFTATLNAEPVPVHTVASIEAERDRFLDTVANNLVLTTPDKVINTLFYFSKIRAAESIFKTTKQGLVHSPGGGSYYAGIWANDQAEYSGPFFPYLGYQIGNEAAMNAYRIFLKNIPKDGGKIWPSFEMDVSLPYGPQDRGDAAMIAFGATHFLLASGSKTKADQLWPLIDWCLKYCEKRKTTDGIIASESDELEGRFQTGSANLSTSCLYYGALRQTAKLTAAMGMPKKLSAGYDARADQLALAIDNYFGAHVDGLDTYKYYKENTTLRSWISLPLVVGLNERRSGTLDALFSKLWSPNGVLTEGGNAANNDKKVFWDRGTLYAFRGAFKAGAADRALERLVSYSTTRLIGFRVPYVVEAWPEGSMAHLSAESALYCRSFIEGLFGIEPHDLNSISVEPNLPAAWNEVELKNIKAYGGSFDINIRRVSDRFRIQLTRGGKKTVITMPRDKILFRVSDN